MKIRIETGYSTVLLDFQKKEGQYVCISSKGDINNLHTKVYTNIVNGNQEYMIVKEEFRSQMVPGMLCVPSDWSYSKKYMGLEVKDSLLIHKQLWGKLETFFLNEEEILTTESLEEMESRLSQYEI